MKDAHNTLLNEKKSHKVVPILFMTVHTSVLYQFCNWPIVFII